MENLFDWILSEALRTYRLLKHSLRSMIIGFDSLLDILDTQSTYLVGLFMTLKILKEFRFCSILTIMDIFDYYKIIRLN